MKKYFLIVFFIVVIASCGDNSKKEIYTELLKEKIGSKLPFEDVRIADIEGGTGVVIDQFYCYWIDSNNKIFCVNGSSKSLMHNDETNKLECEDAPIKAGYLEINSIAK